MDKEEVVEKLKKYAYLVCEKFSPKKIVLFGSYAKGNWHQDSDIDVAIVVDHIEGDILKSASSLFKLRRNIDLRIQPVLFEENNDKSGFLEDIMKYGEIIYSA